jgi:riboflavin kinase/FMN adenylyltransferase
MHVIHLEYPLPVRPSGAGQVVAIGDFDGVHIGHAEVIRRAVETARRLNMPSAVMTFHPHPREVLGQDAYTSCLTPLPAKIDRFAELGVERTYVFKFDRAFSQVTPDGFVSDVLLKLGVDTIVVGFDFTFGRGGAGTPDTLCGLAAGRFAVEVVRPVYLDGEKVSSTLVRRQLEAGEMDRVSRLLGRRYQLTGQVVPGDARGRRIGFPTANIAPDAPYVVPADGVYAVAVEWSGRTYPGVMNIGTRPTFDGNPERRTLEAHLFDFGQTIYGDTVKVEFVSRIRRERKFVSVDELVAQIRQDVETAKRIFAGRAAGPTV